MAGGPAGVFFPRILLQHPFLRPGRTSTPAPLPGVFIHSFIRAWQGVVPMTWWYSAIAKLRERVPDPNPTFPPLENFGNVTVGQDPLARATHWRGEVSKVLSRYPAVGNLVQ